MEEEADLIHLDFADIDRQRLEAICNEALSVLTMGEVTAILASYNVHLAPVVVDGRKN